MPPTRHRWSADELPDDAPLPPSKTQLKQEMHELQAMGLELLQLSDAQLDRLEMPERLREALRDMRGMTNFGARRRQAQFIGKLLRQADEAPLRAALADFQAGQAQAAALHRNAERWRERLLADSAELAAWAAEYPGSDLQVLRNLLRNLQRAAPQDGAAPSAGWTRQYRELFRLLRETLNEVSPEED